MAYAGIIHDHHTHESIEAETDHHHKIDHEHATSHQSFKLHHYHAVPVYVKHEDQHLLKNPIEVGGVKHKLKVKICIPLSELKKNSLPAVTVINRQAIERNISFNCIISCVFANKFSIPNI